MAASARAVRRRPAARTGGNTPHPRPRESAARGPASMGVLGGAAAGASTGALGSPLTATRRAALGCPELTARVSSRELSSSRAPRRDAKMPRRSSSRCGGWDAEMTAAPRHGFVSLLLREMDPPVKRSCTRLYIIDSDQ